MNVAGILHRPDESPGVYLHDYNPSLFRRHFVARPNFPHPLGTEFCLENVGLGKYDVSASGEGMLRVNRMIDISADDLIRPLRSSGRMGRLPSVERSTGICADCWATAGSRWPLRTFAGRPHCRSKTTGDSN